MSDALLNIDIAQSTAILATPMVPPVVPPPAVTGGTSPFNAAVDACDAELSARAAATGAALAAREAALPPAAISGMSALEAMNIANKAAVGVWS
jgi:hypothetical protein